MGLSSSKTKTTSNQNETGSTTPVAPPWLTGQLESFGNQIGQFGQTDPQQYVAPTAPLQQQAFDNVQNLSGWQPQASTASNLAFDVGTGGANLATKQDIPQVAQGPQGVKTLPTHPGELPAPAGGLLSPNGYTPAPSMPGYGEPRPTTANPAITGASQAPAYSNPFDQQVIDTTLQGYDQDAGQRQAQFAASGARNGAFGGSRFGIAEGQLGADLALGRGQLEGGLRQTGFNTANQFGLQDAAAGNQMLQFNAGQQDTAANRQLAAAGLLGDLSNSYDANTRADLGLMADLGGQQRGIEQDYATAPLQQLLAQAGLYGQIPYNALVGQNVTGTRTGTNVTSQTPSLLNQLLAGANAAAGFF